MTPKTFKTANLTSRSLNDRVIEDGGAEVTFVDWKEHGNTATGHRAPVASKRPDDYQRVELIAGQSVRTARGPYRAERGMTVWVLRNGDGPLVLMV